MKKSNENPVIVTDMDEVLVHLLPSWVKYLNKKFNKKVNWKKITDWDMNIAYPDLTEEDFKESLQDEELWKTVKPIKLAMKYLKKLYLEGYEIYVCTASHYSTLNLKLIISLFPNYSFIDYKHIIVCYDKSLIKCDYIIDDNPDNIAKSSAFRILMNTNYNQTAHKQLFDFRADNFKQVYKFITSAQKMIDNLEHFDFNK